jgi:hypothetical protein
MPNLKTQFSMFWIAVRLSTFIMGKSHVTAPRKSFKAATIRSHIEQSFSYRSRTKGENARSWLCDVAMLSSANKWEDDRGR